MAEKDRVRTEQFRFTLLPEENAMLTKNAFEYGLSKSEYLRKLILAESLTGKQWHMDRDQAKQLIYEVNRIGNNVGTKLCLIVDSYVQSGFDSGTHFQRCDTK